MNRKLSQKNAIVMINRVGQMRLVTLRNAKKGGRGNVYR